MRSRRIRAGAVATACATGALSLLGISMAQPAQALGNGVWLCKADTPFYGGSSNSGTSKGAFTQQNSSYACGYVVVAYDYYLYAGSKLYWTNNTYATVYVFQAGTNIVNGGGHKVTICSTSSPYTCGPKYT